MLAGRRYSKGFSIVELLIVISIISVLAVLVFGYAQSTQLKTRDIERAGDVKALSQQFERKYRVDSSTTGPSYPTTAQVSTGSISSVLTGADTEIIKAPKSSGSSVVAATNTTIPQSPTIDQYIYQPFTSSNTLCSASPCVRYILYYRQERDDQVVQIHSTRQQ